MGEDRWAALREDLRGFVDARDWDRFHGPKDLAVGLSVEAGELLEHVQWWDPDVDELRADPEAFEGMVEEVADVLLYAMLLADRLGVDLLEAAHAKLEGNRARYPAEGVRGVARPDRERD